METTREVFDKAAEAFLQETWRARRTDWESDLHYPGAVSVYVEANIDRQPKIFRFHIREQDPQITLPQQEEMTTEEVEKIHQYLKTKSEKAAHYRAEKFRRLADQWYENTRHLSSINKQIMHPAYLQIIGMGPDVIPLVLEELKQTQEHWFPALFALTGEDPAPEGCTFDEAVNAWLEWGRQPRSKDAEAYLESKKQ